MDELDTTDITWDEQKPEWYRIDPNKVKTMSDVVRLLDAINIKFIDTHDDFDKISDLLTAESQWPKNQRIL